MLSRQAMYPSRDMGGKAPDFETKVNDLAQRNPGADTLRVEAVHLDVAAVAHDQPLRSVEEAQPLRHVIERGVEAQVLLTEFLGEAPLLVPPSRGRPRHEEYEKGPGERHRGGLVGKAAPAPQYALLRPADGDPQRVVCETPCGYESRLTVETALDGLVFRDVFAAIAGERGDDLARVLAVRVVRQQHAVLTQQCNGAAFPHGDRTRRIFQYTRA